jgi:hypothetical protein
MFDIFKKFRNKNLSSTDKSVTNEPPAVEPPTKKPTAARKKPQLSPKELATQRGEPWVQIINLELDPSDLGNGAIDLAWNDIFVARLIKAGFRGKTDNQIVDQWFTTVCRNIVLETFEQEMADPDRRTTLKKDLGNGRSEFS